MYWKRNYSTHPSHNLSNRCYIFYRLERYNDFQISIDDAAFSHYYVPFQSILISKIASIRIYRPTNSTSSVLEITKYSESVFVRIYHLRNPDTPFLLLQSQSHSHSQEADHLHLTILRNMPVSLLRIVKLLPFSLSIAIFSPISKASLILIVIIFVFILAATFSNIATDFPISQTY